MVDDHGARDGATWHVLAGGEMLALMHELRTPLTLALGATDDALASPERALRGGALAVVHRSLVRLSRLVDALLDLSRIEAGLHRATYQPSDLCALTRDLASIFRSAAERVGLRLEVDCPALSGPVWVDRRMWEAIVHELLSNALTFTFVGSIGVTISEHDDAIELTVRDTGIGIPQEQLPHLFDRFYRVPNAGARTSGGAGLGLAIVHELVMLHGGTIDVRSRVGAGTAFVVRLSRGHDHLPDHAVSAAPPPASAPRESVGSFRRARRRLPDATRDEPGDLSTRESPATRACVLVVADDADMRAYLRRILSERWTVHCAADAEAALRDLRRRPDLVLADVRMPGRDDLTLLRAIRGDPDMRGSPVLLLSARGGEELLATEIEASADEHIVKPFAAHELLARVATHLALAALRRDLAHERACELQIASRPAPARAADEEPTTRTSAGADTGRPTEELLMSFGHELRNPLAAMRAALDAMRPRELRSRPQEVLEHQLDHLTRLVDDLLDVARFARGRVELHRREVELADVIADAVELASPLVEQRGQRLRVEVPRRGLGVDVDSAHMARVVANLLTNAAKYSEPGGEIALVARRCPTGARLCVEDHGMGIAPDMLRRIFEPFEQQKHTAARARGGLGLGLALVRHIVELHGGRVHAHSAGIGRGSKLVVELPALPHPVRPSAREPATRDPGSR